MAFIEKIVVLGSGSSSSTPQLKCLLSTTPCAQCTEAAADMRSPNHRLNPSLLVQIRDGPALRNVLFDCGKTFRETVLKVFPQHGITTLDAVVITHDHMDACGGLDDLREFCSQKHNNAPLPVYCDAKTLDSLKPRYPYLFQQSALWTPALEWTTIDPEHRSPFAVCGVTLLPCYVLHGPEYLSCAFVLPLGDAHAAYISDVSSVPPETLGFLQQFRYELLITDMLSEKEHMTHCGFDSCLELVNQLAPRKAYVVGMGHGVSHRVFTDRFHAATQGLCTLATDGLAVFGPASSKI